MPRQHRHLAAFWLSFLALGALTDGLAHAVELRSSYGGRTVVRPVSTRAAAEEEEAPAPAPRAVKEAEKVVEMPYEGDYVVDEGYLDQGMMYDSCGDTGCMPCMPICGETLWVELDFLLWWREGRNFPPLATANDPGLLPNAPILFGGDQLKEQARPGGRLEVGWWLDSCQSIGIGGHFVSLGDAETRFSVDSNDMDFLARPFLNVDPAVNAQDAQVIFNTAIGQTGSMDLLTDSEFTAADAFVRCLWLRNACSRVDFIFGYQFGRLDEGLVIQTQTTDPDLGSFGVMDSILTENEFHGGHFGLQGEYRWGMVGLELMGKFAFGNLQQRAVLSGATSNSTQNSGLLVQQETNAGVWEQDESAYMHDVGAKLTYYPVERLKLSIGYSLMFISDVLRPGDQIDLAIDGRFFPATTAPADATRPAFDFDSTHFYLHGINVGLECNF